MSYKKRYKAILKQDNGCDYTIGCGITTIDIGVDNFQEAEIILKDIIAEDFNTLETKLSKVTLYEVTDKKEFDIEEYYVTLQRINDIANNINKEENERLEYERLCKKYNGK